MTGPTGLIFAMRSRFDDQSGAEALVDEADAEHSADNASSSLTSAQQGTNPSILNDSPEGTYTFAQGMTTAQAEALGDTTDDAFAEMAFSIEKHTVTCLLYTSPSPRDLWISRMPSSA